MAEADEVIEAVTRAVTQLGWALFRSEVHPDLIIVAVWPRPSDGLRLIEGGDIVAPRPS
jgi:hypothetical protein